MRGLASFSISALVVGLACGACGTSATPPPSVPPAPVAASPASGDFTWSIDRAVHPLRAGAATIGAGGAIEIVLTDHDVRSPCDLAAEVGDPRKGPERVLARVPRGLDVAYPLGRAISPDLLRLLPLDGTLALGGGRLVPRYALVVDTVEWKPGGRVVGSLAWVGVPKGAAPGIALDTSGEGRFDVPLCASADEIAGLDTLPPPHPVELSTLKGPVRGTTLTSPFTGVRAFAELRPWFGLPPHVEQIEIYPDPFVTCETRAAAKGTAIVVEIDAETGLGRHLGEREPIGAIECVSTHTRWECLGSPDEQRGFVVVRELNLRVGGALRGVMDVAGEGTTSLKGAFDVELCSGK